MMSLKIVTTTLLLTAVTVLSVASAHADFFYKLVGYQCDEKADTLTLTYNGGLNEAGKMMMQNKGPREWDPWKLIIKDKKKKSCIASHKTAGGHCKLSDGIYDVSVGPLPGNANLQGMCGGFMSAWAEVRRGPDIVLPRHEFEFGDCHVTQPVTTRITIQAGNKEPIIEKIPWDDFYKVKP